MKITVKQNVLSKALLTLTKVIKKTKNKGSFNTCTLHIVNNELIVQGRDHCSKLVVNTGVKCEYDNVDNFATVLFNEFRTYIQALSGNITLTKGEKFLIVTSGDLEANFALQTYFDMVTNSELQTSLVLDKDMLFDRIKACKMSLSKLDEGKSLDCFHIRDTGNNTVMITTTNGFRATIGFLSMKEKASFDIAILGESLIQFTKMLSTKQHGDIIVDIKKNSVVFNFENISYEMCKVENKFPMLGCLFDEDYTSSVVLDTKVLRDSLKSIKSLLKKEDKHFIKFSYSNNSITITSHEEEINTKASIPLISSNGDLFDISFNITYLLDILNVYSNSTIIIEFTDRHGKIRVKDVLTTYIFLPVRINNNI